MPRVKGMNLSKDERRDLILHAGLVTFCRMGYDGANIDDIARESNCSHGLIYYYFKNKEEIFRELVKDAARSAEKMSAFLRENRTGPSPRARLLSVTREILSMVENDDNFFYYFQFATMLKLLKKDLPDLKIEPPKYLPYDELRAIVAAGQELGEFAPGSPDAYANVYLAIVQGLANRKAFTEGHPYPPFVMPSAEMILQLFSRERENAEVEID